MRSAGALPTSGQARKRPADEAGVAWREAVPPASPAPTSTIAPACSSSALLPAVDHTGAQRGAGYPTPPDEVFHSVGGEISPLLANVYLHYVFDLWIQSWRRRHAHRAVYVVRYADDFVVGFESEREALLLRRDLELRLAKFGLELHPDKTRVLRFGRFARADRERRRLGKPETFEFLGFRHIAGRDLQGKFQLMRHTSRRKMQAKLARIKEACRRRRHAPVGAQHAWLVRVLRGHDNYYAVPTNTTGLRRFHAAVEWTWHRSLQRRSQRGRWNNEQRRRFRQRFPLPSPRILHPWPPERFYARFNRGGSPVREIRSPGSVWGAR